MNYHQSIQQKVNDLIADYPAAVVARAQTLQNEEGSRWVELVIAVLDSTQFNRVYKHLEYSLRAVLTSPVIEIRRNEDDMRLIATMTPTIAKFGRRAAVPAAQAIVIKVPLIRHSLVPASQRWRTRLLAFALAVGIILVYFLTSVVVETFQKFNDEAEASSRRPTMPHDTQTF